MRQTQIGIFIILATIILLIFIGGILMFIVQYRKRKVIHEKEKTIMNETHHRELLSTQVQIQQQTMQDIGREIHDNVGQRLTLASIYANQLLAETGASVAGGERIASISAIINESLAELRNLSRSLVSNDADSSELEALLAQECARVNALGICEVCCRFTDARFAISATAKNFIIRIVQEFLQNSLKHAACRHIALHLGFEERGLTLLASDDGAGFDINSASAGIGLVNMRKRAELIGARFELSSAAAEGTRMQLFIPIEKLAE